MERRVEAIILRAAREGDFDRVLSLFCREEGRLLAVARGADKPKSRWAGRIELFSQIHALLVEKGLHPSRATLTQCELIRDRRGVRGSLARMAAAASVCGWLDALTPLRAPPGALWDLAAAVLDRVEKAPRVEPIVLGFRLRMLWEHGVLPGLSCCTRCEAPYPDGRRARFVGAAGGIVCAKCLREGESYIQIPASGMRLLFQFIGAPPEVWETFSVPGGLQDTLEHVIETQVRFHLDWEPLVDDWLKGDPARAPRSS